MVTINIHEAKTYLSKYARMVKSGETIILCDRNVPFAEWRPLPPAAKRKKRRLGQLKGQCTVGKAFFESDAEVARLFTNSPDTPLTGK
jgi:antitoxin (DNA-binding transcriptional repressor) of toxin-antitoxin stability system